MTAYSNRTHVLVLQYPQERTRWLSSAGLLNKALANVEFKRGLSWKKLVENSSQWGVLYLGTVKGNEGLRSGSPLMILDRKGVAVENISEVAAGLKGIVVLDGSWQESKTLWWRNPWLLKLRRLVLRPEKVSRYGNLRKEPRRECLSTLEAVALALRELEKNPAVENHLLGYFEKMLGANRKIDRRRSKMQRSISAQKESFERRSVI